MMRRRRILKVALKSLKIAYVQVETPKYPRPCTLACNCEIIWASDSGQVGGGRANFEITLVERPSKKSCSTSFFKENPL